MPFGRKASGLTRVFEFGARVPHTGMKAMLDEIHRRHNLWNMLVEMDRANQIKVNSLIRSELDDLIEARHKDLEVLRKNVKALRSKAAYTAIEYGYIVHQLRELMRQWHALLSSNIAPSLGEKEGPRRAEFPKYKQIPLLMFEEPADLTAVQAQIKKLQENIRPLYAKAKKIRARNVKKYAKQLKALNVGRMEKVKSVVIWSGAHWMNSEEVVNSYEKARINALTQGRQLRFHSWNGEGKISIRYQQGRPASELFDLDSRLQIQQMAPDAWTGSRSVRRKTNHTEVHIRVGKDHEWVIFTAYLHRTLPKDASIRGASLKRTKVGLQYKYHLLITVRCIEPEATKLKPRLTVHLDWSIQDNGSLQVARWEDSKGKTGKIILPADMIKELDKLNDLRALYKQYQNEAAEVIKKVDVSRAPEWFQEDMKVFAHWESPKRYLKLYRIWRENRFKGDKAAFTALDTFQERYMHLYPWESNLRDQILNHRRELYRIFAAQAVKKYGVIEMDDKCLISAGGGQLDRNIRKWTRIAAASILRSTIKNTAARVGVLVQNPAKAKEKEMKQVA